MPTYEEMRELRQKREREREEFNKKREEMRIKELEAKGIKPFDISQVPPQRCDHPNTMEDSTATIVWIVAMIISLLFKGGWALCILETIIWLKFITRYKK
jgi:hypothetical protein